MTEILASLLMSATMIGFSFFLISLADRCICKISRWLSITSSTDPGDQRRGELENNIRVEATRRLIKRGLLGSSYFKHHHNYEIEQIRQETKIFNLVEAIRSGHIDITHINKLQKDGLISGLDYYYCCAANAAAMETKKHLIKETDNPAIDSIW